jgi:hypothetical protein
MGTALRSTASRKRCMTTMFEEAGMFGKEFADNGLKSFDSLSTTAQAIVTETSDYTKRSFEMGASAFEKLVSAKSAEAVVEIQTDYAKQAYQDFVSETGRLSNLYADMAREAYKPFESLIAKAQ